MAATRMPRRHLACPVARGALLISGTVAMLLGLQSGQHSGSGVTTGFVSCRGCQALRMPTSAGSHATREGRVAMLGKKKKVDPEIQRKRDEARRKREEALRKANEAKAEVAESPPVEKAPPPAPPPAAPKAAPKVAKKSSRAPAKTTAKAAGTTLTAEAVKQMKVVDLKDELRKAGLKVSGVKAVLLERLLEHIGAA
eukprot:TRINITY_DN68567_c0_g1_i1.p1 TRINITY_DN68567_c0_g1~~TRINITY_DN68567_c0_g1_i1.p1  ORF type:complete len:216 (-),score=44.40 TRINITY_DN68567_c0_g1_i1:23-613(-)